MRIDSGTIGMESARSYTSVSGRVSKFTITNGRQGLENGTSSLLGNLVKSDVEGEETQTTEEEPAEGTLQTKLEEMRAQMKAYSASSIRDIDMEEARKQMAEIRQQCLDFLMNILFPERRTIDAQNSTESEQAQEGTASTTDNLISAIGVNVKTFQYSRQYYYEETENTTFSTQGTVKCADGREINFNLNMEMSRSFQEYYEENISYMQVSMCDPLVINLEGNIAELSDQTFLFDIDADGEQDEVSRLQTGSGFLALDKNGDGTINDGSELFGTSSGNGFKDLAAYDTDKNGFIDEGDDIWNKLKIWVMDENGEPQLYSLAEKGVGAIGLMNQSTDFSLTGKENQTNGMIRNTGIFLYESGTVGTVQHVDMTKHNRAEQALAAYDALYSDVV